MSRLVRPTTAVLCSPKRVVVSAELPRKGSVRNLQVVLDQPRTLCTNTLLLIHIDHVQQIGSPASSRWVPNWSIWSPASCSPPPVGRHQEAHGRLQVRVVQHGPLIARPPVAEHCDAGHLDQCKLHKIDHVVDSMWTPWPG